MLFHFFKKPPTPFNTGYLPEDNGHRVFYHEYGRKDGPVVLVFHGGPGSYAKPRHTDTFDLKTYRVILFDQRGCGKSEPAGCIEHNTAQDLIDDAKRILDQFGIQQAIVSGSSWGSTLALLFAETYPERVAKLIIGKTFLARQQDIEWIAVESRKFYPDIYETLENDVSAGKSLRQHYADLVLSDKDEEQIRSTQLYGRYEYMVGSLDPAFTDDMPTPEHRQSYKIYMHYDQLNYGIRENQLLDDIATIAHIPTLILHNRLDLICPVEQAWSLHKSLPGSKLVIVPEMGHGGTLYNAIAKQEVAAFLTA